MFCMIFPMPIEQMRDRLDNFNPNCDTFKGVEPIWIKQFSGNRKDAKIDVYSELYFQSLCYKRPLYVYFIHDRFYYKNFKFAEQGFIRIVRQSLISEMYDLEVRKLPYQHLLLPKNERILNGDFESLENSVYNFIDTLNLVKIPITGFFIDKDFVSFSEEMCERIKNSFLVK